MKLEARRTVQCTRGIQKTEPLQAFFILLDCHFKILWQFSRCFSFEVVLSTVLSLQDEANDRLGL
jgi:hypothetical protein